MVGRPGFEPGTNNLKGCCSTIELSSHANTSRQLFLPARARQELFVFILEINSESTVWLTQLGPSESPTERLNCSNGELPEPESRR